MCLILIKEPEYEIDFSRLRTAVVNNPHGWGYVIPDRGKLEIRRFYDKDGTNPDDVAKVLEDAIDQRVFLHLRWATAGNNSKFNCHPFPVLKQRRDGMQVWLMHNGTISDFKGDSQQVESDTHRFTKEIMTPLLQRTMKYTGKKACISDPFVHDIMKKYAGGFSKLVLVDNYGNHSIVGDGTSEEGYWASNDYSFTPGHRQPSSGYRSNNYAHAPRGDYDDEYKAFSRPQTDIKQGVSYVKNEKTGVWEPATSQHKPGGFYIGPGADKANAEEAKQRATGSPFVGSTSNNDNDGMSQAGFWERYEDEDYYTPTEKAKKQMSKSEKEDDGPLDNPPKNTKKRTSASILLGLESLEDMCYLAESDILDLVADYPQLMTVLIRDLLRLLYVTKEEEVNE